MNQYIMKKIVVLSIIFDVSTFLRSACCEQTYNVWRWCNVHCGGCFACDPTGCQNFMVTQ